MFTEHWQKQQQDLSQKVPAWLQSLRQAGLEQFDQLGLPTPQNESWKYTNVRPLQEIPFELGAPYQAKTFEIEPLPCATFEKRSGIHLSFVNGHFVKNFSNLESLPKGVEVLSLAQAIAEQPEAVQPYLKAPTPQEDEPFAALNTAFLQDGAYLRIGKGVVVEQPIELSYFSLSNGSATVSHPRTLIVAEPGSQVTVVETYAGKLSQNPYFTNALTEVFAGSGAVVRHYKIQDECEQSFHLGSLRLQQAASSTFSSTNISIGAILSRHEVYALLKEPGADCSLNGLSMVHGQQHVDHQTKIDHAAPQCQSHELYKGILDDRSHGVFNGQILVRPGAQKTQSSLTNNNLLLSQEAVIDTKPLLEILNDDVKCSHAATIGRLDENQIFYLRSRGLAEPLARHLLTYAFASEIVHELKVRRLRAQLEEILLNRLQIHELSVEGESA